MPKVRNITELEGTVLGVIGIKGPCSPYLVRKEFLQSSTPYWSGSAGAIYPLIERLVEKDLIKETPSTQNRRGGKLYILTADGESVLKDWLYQPFSASLIGTPPDPLRNRIEFLGLLNPEMRKSFLREVKVGLEEHLKVIITDNENLDQSNYFDYLSFRGAVLATAARLAWIEEAIDILDKQKH